MSEQPINEFLDELVEEIKVAPKLYHQFEQLQADVEAKDKQIAELRGENEKYKTFIKSELACMRKLVDDNEKDMLPIVSVLKGKIARYSNVLGDPQADGEGGGG